MGHHHWNQCSTYSESLDCSVASQGLSTSAGYTGKRNPADRSQWGPVNFAHKGKAYVRCLKTQIFALTICKRGQGTCSRDRTGQNCRRCSNFKHPNLTTLPSCVAELGQCWNTASKGENNNCSPWPLRSDTAPHSTFAPWVPVIYYEWKAQGWKPRGFGMIVLGGLRKTDPDKFLCLAMNLGTFWAGSSGTRVHGHLLLFS